MNDLSPKSDSISERANALPIYLDNQASTPVDPRVLEAMLPYFTIDYGNPHSESHVYGHRAMTAIDAARGQIASLIHADPREIIFTSGATEANNMALKGAAHFAREHPSANGPKDHPRDHIVTLTTEHKCVLESGAALEREGFSVTYLPVAENGLVSLDALAAALTERTLIVSIMAAHNEIGVIQPLAEIGALCRARGVLFHTDAAQALGKIPLNVEAMKIDLMSMSGHKLYGPKGVGALYVRRRPRVRLTPLIDGGGQERGLRSGTLPTPLCVGFGKACALAEAEMTGEAARLTTLRERLQASLAQRVPGLLVNGDIEHRLPGSLNVSVPGTTAPDLIEACPSIAISTGSACTSASVEPSYVLRALGLSDARANASIRLGLGRFTTATDVDYAADAIAAAAARLRQGTMVNSDTASPHNQDATIDGNDVRSNMKP
jgi:cysteine desulfurase